MRRKAICVALCAVLAGCVLSSKSRAQAPVLPELPTLSLDNLAPMIRTAIQEAYDAVQAHPLDASANGKLGMVLHAHSFLAEAEVCYQRARLLDPKTFRWTYYLGVVQLSQAKCDEAIVTLSQYSDYLPAQLSQGECLVGSGRWEEAGKLYEEMSRKHPETAEAYYGLGRVRAASKDLNGAVQSFQKACQLFPHYAAAHHALARVYQRLGKSAEAQNELALVKSSEGAFPGTEDPLLTDVQEMYRDFGEYLKLGSKLAGKGDYEQSAAAYEGALEINPDLSEAHARLTFLYGQLGQNSKAEEHYRAALRLDPTKPEPYFFYGGLLMNQGKSLEAEEAFRKVIEIDPHHAEAHTNLGYLLEGRGKLAEAITEFQQALEKSPTFPKAHFNLGRILVKQENYEEGIPHLLKALSTEDESLKSSYLHALGIAFASFGDRENALRYMQLARQRASAQNQAELAKRIDEDLTLLGGASAPR